MRIAVTYENGQIFQHFGHTEFMKIYTVENGEIVSKGALGFQDPENTLPITEDTIFQLASISKQFTATAVMLLMRQGLLSPEDEITKVFADALIVIGLLGAIETLHLAFDTQAFENRVKWWRQKQLLWQN